MGSYVITVTPGSNPNYTLTLHPGSLAINARSASITAGTLSKTYGEDDPDFTATVEDAIAGDALNYTLSREPGEGAGLYAITVTPGSNPNYTLTVYPGSLSIVPKALTAPGVAVAPIGDQVYTGREICPDVTLTDGGAALLADRDFTLSYESNRRVGTAAVLVDGMGNYTGELRLSFAIKARSARIPAEPSMSDQADNPAPILIERLDSLLLISAFPDGTDENAPWSFRSLSLPAAYIRAQAAQGVQMIVFRMGGLRLLIPAAADEQSDCTLIIEPVAPGEETQPEREAMENNPPAAERWHVRILKDGKDIKEAVPGMELRFETGEARDSAQVLYLSQTGEIKLLDAPRHPGLMNEPDYFACPAQTGGLYAILSAD